MTHPSTFQHQRLLSIAEHDSLARRSARRAAIAASIMLAFLVGSYVGLSLPGEAEAPTYGVIWAMART